jgi:hypothetical protein
VVSGGSSSVTTGTPLQVEPQPVAAEDRVTEVRLLLPENTLTPSVGASPKKVTEVRAFPLNADVPILATESGIISDEMLFSFGPLSANADSPIEVTWFPRSNAVKEFLKKAPTPIVSTEFGIDTVVSGFASKA